MMLFLLAFSVSTLAVTTPENDVTVKTRACLPPHDQYPPLRSILMYQPHEKPHLLTARNGGGGSPGPGSNITRLGLPEYDWGVNCVHGAQTNCIQLKSGKIVCPTSFPNPVNYGMTFNVSLFQELGQVIATELRALWLLGATEYSAWSGRGHAGLDCWSPNINIARDPRWGRNQETPSEDPYLNGLFGYWYTKGIQEGEDPRYIKVVVTLKHWDAYSLEDSDGFTRHDFNAVISNYTLHDTYFPAFKASVVSGKAKGIMCSYNAVNGIPTCAHPYLTSILDSWNYTGYITSDTDAIMDIWKTHKFTKTEEEAACKAIVDGRCDINSGTVYHTSLLLGVSKGLCTMRDVDRALAKTLKLRFELGLFDPIEEQPYWHVPPESIGTLQAQESNNLAALESMVLLKNEGNVLPLSPGKTIAVIGPHGKAQSALVGNYLGQLCPQDGYGCIETPFDAITKLNKGGKVLYEAGCGVTSNDTSKFAAALNAAKQADHVVLFMGIDENVEAESHDRTSIDLPYIQHKLIDLVLTAKKPTVLVLLNGGMVAIEQEKETVPAIVEAGYPGMLGAQAIAKTIFGQNNHLGGKLPYTVYPANYVNQVKMSYMEMEAKPGVSPGRTYRYYTGVPTYPFGYGLSLTKFSLKVDCPAPLVSGDVTVSVQVKNEGTRTGDEVVQVYLKPTSEQQPDQEQPWNKEVNAITWSKKLVSFERIHLLPGETKTLKFVVPIESFATVDVQDAGMVYVPGTYQLEFSNGVDQSSTCNAVL